MATIGWLTQLLVIELIFLLLALVQSHQVLEGVMPDTRCDASRQQSRVFVLIPVGSGGDILIRLPFCKVKPVKSCYYLIFQTKLQR